MLNRYNYDIELDLYLKPITKTVIDEILKHTNKRGIAFPSVKTIDDNINYI
ncbi:hypothetical protein Curi_c13940 [Gottschalkia acidurici 9a]|uniref:Uncharacterized protein n=1 Tax=Gottschalkia acidurici (strain ATCC 7906 / DSM 604 / BCRC 14475 / CIP 104303 / KCTC 5404 / NCIMB 10678 / 9a) TaxID=1128398 RepID=K0AYT8_GOTA9|nr:hypothetical protein [Gottschalkia acidurici]AFS78404.1 hypothetical protein Curi_c13940 [Gottschalkia acidurici 9a]